MRIVASVPPARRDALHYLDVPSTSAFGFNPLDASPETRALAASGVLDVFKKLWADSWGPRLEHLLRYALLALVEAPGTTFADLLRILEDDEFRRDVARHVTNPQVRRFWLREYEQYSAGRRAEAIAPLQNKVGAFLAHPRLQELLSRPSGVSELRGLLQAGGILVVNLSKGRLGEDASSLFGALLLSTLARLSLERAAEPESDRTDFAIYLDEFQTFTTLTLAGMLAELRKYRVNLVLAHQHLAQLDVGLREAILGNAGTLVVFRLGPSDARVLSALLNADLEAGDLTRLPNHEFYVRLLVDGAPVPAFSAKSLWLRNWANA
jgi:hypothetical protein